MRRLLDCLAAVHQEGGIDCGAAARHFTSLCEQALNGADIHDILPQAAAHIAHCPDCQEEYEALLAVLRAEKSGETHIQPRGQ
ncbi:MAG: hypothetical protein OXB89_10030 [Anaerolineaceae bacterium]|nr:hypothetical protein [Anaerolineaceae bacterium]